MLESWVLPNVDQPKVNNYWLSLIYAVVFTELKPSYELKHDTPCIWRLHPQYERPVKTELLHRNDTT